MDQQVSFLKKKIDVLKGFALGGLFGLFLGSTSFAEPSPIPNSTVMQLVKQAYKGVGTAMYKNAKSFGKIGAVFSVTECVIEKVNVFFVF